MELSVGQKAAFKTYNNKVIVGKVICITNKCYLVLPTEPTEFCHTYSDGMYRFTDANIVR